MKRLLGLVLVFAACSAYAAPSLWVGSSAGAPGATVMVPVYYASDTNAPSLQFDLHYATNDLAAGEPVGGSALADHLFGTSEFTSGIRRVLIFSFSNTPLTNGVLVYIPFTISSNAVDHDEGLSLSNVLVVSAAAEIIPYSSLGDAVLSISPPPQFSPAFAAGSGSVHLQFAGTTGRKYVVEATTDFLSGVWQSLATNTAAGGAVNFDDPFGQPSRYYRARLLL